MIRIITSLVAALTVTSIHSQTTTRNDIPKLVISITIDQLRSDYLDLFNNSLSEKGLKKLLNEGIVYSNIIFEYPNLNSASSIATIQTGSNPFYHGISGSNKFSADKNAEISIFEDNAYLGNYTKEKLSPKALKSSTVADELKKASNGKSLVYSFAPNSFEAIISGGHNANTAYWLEDFTGKWATSTFYKDYPWTVDLQNKNSVYSNHPESLVWQILLNIDKYQNVPYTKEIKYLNYKWKQNSTDIYQQLKQTPFVNEYITQTAIQIIEKADMGKHPYPDFLSITYYAGNYSYSDVSEYSVEQQDIYYRLDKDISSLLEHVEKSVGLQNTLIVVTPTGYYNTTTDIDNKSEIFYSNRCEALLNMYLIAIYGNGQWVERYYDKQIYLNRKLIESKNLSLKEIQDKAAEFVIQFTGVQDATTITSLLSGDANTYMAEYRNSLNKDVSGDIFLEITPGYEVVDERITLSQNKVQKETAIVAPIIFWGFNIKPQKIKRSVKATEIAPTISRILRIRSPNGAKEQPLIEFM